MAFPVVKINNLSGSDTLASGAGPATAITGTDAFSPSGSSWIGLGSATDLSSVSTDGSAALYVATASGRRFTQIVGKKDSQETTTGDITSGSAVITNIPDTSPFVVGQVFYGPAGTYRRVVSVDGPTQITVNSAYGFTTAGQTLTIPRQVQVTDAIGIGSGVSWAIGGKRATLTGSTALFSDFKAGWRVEVELTGTAYQGGVQYGASGDLTNGQIVVEGTWSVVQARPVITSSTNGQSLFDLNGQSYLCFKFLEFTHTAATRGNAIFVTGGANSTNLKLYDCVFDGVAAAVNTASSRSWSNSRVERCEAKNTTSHAFSLFTSDNVAFAGCYIHDCAGDALNILRMSRLGVYRCVMANNGGYAIRSTDQFGNGVCTLVASTFYRNSLGGYRDVTGASAQPLLRAWDCVFWGTGAASYAIEQTTATLAQMEAVGPTIHHCAFGNYTTPLSANLVGLDVDTITLTVDPFTDGGAGDFSLNDAAGGGALLKQAGFPGAFPGGTFTSYGDVGAVQSQGVGSTLILVED